MLRLSLGLSICFLISCGDDGGTKVPAGCQPLLGGQDCLLPYPSDFFRVPDATMPSGFALRHAPVALLHDIHGHIIDPTTVWTPDGFSRTPLLVATLPAPVTRTGLTGILDDYGPSATAQSPTVIIEAQSGKLIPHFVDLDPRSTDPRRQPIVIQPMVQLAARTRYVVALHGLVGSDGKPVPPAPGFAALRDKRQTDAHFEHDIFPVLQSAGVARADLQLAWDFTTGSDERPQGDMLHVRQLTLDWLATSTPAVTIDSVQPNTYDDVWQEIHGTITVPLFLDSPNPGARLFRGADGQVTQNGMATVPFTCIVPKSLETATTPARLLAYGHGFFGTQDELRGASTRHIFDRLGVVAFGIDWWGMSTPDAGKVAGYLAGDASQTLVFIDRVHQAMANWLVMTAAMRGPLAARTELHRSTGEPLYDNHTVYFLGISEGHILGSVMSALNPDLERVALNVGGAGWTHMMFRAEPFGGFLGVLDVQVPDPLDQQKWAAMSTQLFDRQDPAEYAQYVFQSPLAPGKAKRVLIQTGLGDDEVPNVASFLQARILGLPEVSPNGYAAWGLEQKPAPIDGSAITVWDFGIDLHFYETPVPGSSENGVHEGLRRLDTCIDQMSAHFQPDGMITNPCNGVCTGSLD